VSLDRRALDDLLGVTLRPAVSLLMPARPAGADFREDPIRLKNMVREAADQLELRGLMADDAARLLAPAMELVEDRGFWRQPERGLAIYAASNFFRCHGVARPLRELVTVADRFHVIQLLPALELERPFYVLALSQKNVRLVEATRASARDVKLGDLPRNPSAALLYDTPEPQPSTVLDRKEEILQFFHVVDRGLRPFLTDRAAPLVLAAVDYLAPLYRETNTHPRLLSETIAGNPDGLSPRALGARGWEIVRPHFETAGTTAVERLRELLGLGRASVDLVTVLRAACEGRVSELLVADGRERWGAFEPDSGAVTLRDRPGPTGEDLLNLAAVLALEHRGAVHVVDRGRIPGDAELAAIFRY